MARRLSIIATLLFTPLVFAQQAFVSKTGAPDPVTAGSNLTYTITVTAGASDLDTGELIDTLPPSTTFVSLNAPPGWSCATGATIDCTTNTMFAGSQAQFTLVVQVSPSASAGTITNVVTFNTTANGRSATTSASANTQVIVSADLSIAKNDTPDPVVAGGNITYAIDVTNPGPSDAASVTLSDTIPALTLFVSLTPPAGWSCSGTSTITCSTASMSAGTASFQLVVKTDASAAGTTVSNTATVASSSDTNAANNSATASTTVNFALGQIPLLGGRELVMLALLLAAIAALALRR